MKKISLVLIGLGLSTSPLLVDAMSSSNMQNSSYESGKQVGEEVDSTIAKYQQVAQATGEMADKTKVKIDKAWQATKVNLKAAAAYVKEKSVHAKDITVAKYHQATQTTSGLVEKTKVKASETWGATKANSQETAAYVKDKSIQAKNAAANTVNATEYKSDEVENSTSEALSSFDQGIENGSK